MGVCTGGYIDAPPSDCGHSDRLRSRETTQEKTISDSVGGEYVISELCKMKHPMVGSAFRARPQSGEILKKGEGASRRSRIKISGALGKRAQPIFTQNYGLQCPISFGYFFNLRIAWTG